MLHMVVLTHEADTCAAGNPEYGDMAREMVQQIDKVAGRNKVKVKGFWVDPPAHKFFLLADAPSAHAVSKMLVDLHLFLWNTSETYAVETLEEAMPLAAKS